MKDQLCVRRHCHIGNYLCHTVQRVSKSRFDIHLAVQNGEDNQSGVVQKEWLLSSKASTSVDCGSGNDTPTCLSWYDRGCIGKIAKVSQG